MRLRYPFLGYASSLKKSDELAVLYRAPVSHSALQDLSLFILQLPTNLSSQLNFERKLSIA